MKIIDARLFWGRLDYGRDLIGLTPTELCESKVDLLCQTLTQQRTRNIFPNVETLVPLAEALAVNLGFLVSDTKEVFTIAKNSNYKQNLS